MTGVYIAILVVLVIAALAIRDQTAVNLGRMRSELMSKRTQEQHMGNEKVEVQQLVDWVAEGVKRAQDRQESAQKACQELRDFLEKASIHVEPVKIDIPEEQTPS